MKNKLNKKVSIVIPNYNGLALLKKHLDKVLACLRDKDELVIVDDASSDQSIDWLLKKFKIRNEEQKTDYLGNFTIYYKDFSLAKKKTVAIKIVKNKQNIRFAGNSNRGVSLAEHNLIFLINSDVAPTKDVLIHLIPHFLDKTMFAVGCMEIEANEKLKGGKNVLQFKKGMFIHRRADEFSTGPTAWASGGSAMFDRQKWLTLSGFDLDYAPAYWEDVDLSFRARKRGWQVLFEEKAVVYHNHESTNLTVLGKKKMNRVSWRNAQKFVSKNGNIIQKTLYLLWQPYWFYQRSKNQ
ncbi:MAG: glycosyltransferase [Patescibacteria group bacterium]|nr:glycosyltransferase [Patescibacteria group bacterium]